jgi:hypothetical protein
MYLLFKSLHIFFMISWFAGLFYLPRIYVNLAMKSNTSTEYQHLLIMARKLYRFMTPWCVGAVVCGLLIPAFSFGYRAGWIHIKILCAILLIIYHFYCGLILRQFEHGQNSRSHKWYRVFNELPVFVLILAIYFVIYKPF